MEGLSYHARLVELTKIMEETFKVTDRIEFYDMLLNLPSSLLDQWVLKYGYHDMEDGSLNCLCPSGQKHPVISLKDLAYLLRNSWMVPTGVKWNEDCSLEMDLKCWVETWKERCLDG